MPEITMYTKRSCSYCVRAEQLLLARGVERQKINYVNVEEDPAQLQIMLARTGRRSVPQIYINDYYVGGFDELSALDHSGKLKALLAQ